MHKTNALARTVKVLALSLFFVTFLLPQNLVAAADYSVSTDSQKMLFVNQNKSISVTVNSSVDIVDSIIDFEIYNTQGQKVFQKFFEHQNVVSGQNQNLSFDWTPSTLGSYKLKAGIFSNNWSQNYYWQDNVSVFEVTNQNAPTVSIKDFGLSLIATPPNFKLSVKPTQNITDSIVDFEIYNTQGQKVFQKFFEHQNLSANTISDYQIVWDQTSLVNYSVKAGIFSNNWGQNYYWQDNLTTVSNTQPISADEYRVEYWNINENFSNPNIPQSTANFTTSVNEIDYDFGSSSPDSKINKDNYVARFVKQQNFEAGSYRFDTTSDDGIRLWVDDKILIDQWNNHSAAIFSASVDLTKGVHNIKLEYFENTGDAVIKMKYSKSTQNIVADNTTVSSNSNNSANQNNSFSNTTYTVGGDGKIYKNGQKISLNGVSWFGAETETKVPHGLWQRNYKEMIAQMKQLGFNAVRLPYCPQALQNVDAQGIDAALNPDLVGLKTLDVMDKIVNEMNRQGVYILMDSHRPDCYSQSDLWYTSSYSESQWINDLSFLADRYKGLEYFIGLDIKNEPKGTATWGTGNASTDWKIAAEKAGKNILSKNPNLLIFVQGIENNPTCSDNSNGHWWGGNLEPQKCFPIDSNSIPANKLVFTPHVYGPDVFNQGYFNVADFPRNLISIWDSAFGFLKNEGRAVVPGEFGGKYGHGGDPKDIIWQNALVDYMKSKGITDTFYWSWNPNSGDTGGILKDDWSSVWQDKVDLLNKLK